MLTTTTLVLALCAAPPWDQLQPVEDEIATLQARRAEVERAQGLAAREAQDRRVALLRRVHARTIAVIQRRTDVCLASLGGEPPRIRDATEAHLAMSCAAQVGDVVTPVRELEELKEKLATEQGTLANHDARRALKARLQELERAL